MQPIPPSELEAAITRTVQENPEWFRRLVIEALEDEGLFRAMEEAEKEGLADPEEVKKLLRDEN